LLSETLAFKTEGALKYEYSGYNLIFYCLLAELFHTQAFITSNE